MKATIANAITVAPKEIVMDLKLIPIGDSPKKRPISPVIPKLNDIDRTRDSMISRRFLPRKSMLIKQ